VSERKIRKRGREEIVRAKNVGTGKIAGASVQWCGRTGCQGKKSRQKTPSGAKAQSRAVRGGGAKRKKTTRKVTEVAVKEGEDRKGQLSRRLFGQPPKKVCA